MNARSAARIGLLPRQLADRAEAVGNAAGSGASGCLLRRKCWILPGNRREVRYAELSALKIFNEKYIEKCCSK